MLIDYRVNKHDTGHACLAREWWIFGAYGKRQMRWLEIRPGPDNSLLLDRLRSGRWRRRRGISFSSQNTVFCATQLATRDAAGSATDHATQAWRRAISLLLRNFLGNRNRS